MRGNELRREEAADVVVVGNDKMGVGDGVVDDDHWRLVVKNGIDKNEG